MISRMPVLRITLAASAVALVAGCAILQGARVVEVGTHRYRITPFAEEAWRGVHICMSNRSELPWLHRAIKEVFAAKGVNTIVIEVDYAFDYASHPELSAKPAMTKADARELVALCRAHGIRLIPQFQCFGHQGARPNLLLTNYPELMVPRVPDYDDPAFYSLSWNPLDPKTNEIVFALFDELIDAFQPEAFHVGLDEVMLFPDESTPYYHGETHAEVFARVVNDLHGHLVKEKGLTMLMWGDRLLDDEAMQYGPFESSQNGTWPAIDMIPKDIIVCDWHYLRRKGYPSVRHFQEKGFRVIPGGWKSPSAAVALIECAQRDATDRMLGYLCTSWSGTELYCKALLGETLPDSRRNTVNAAKTFHAVADVWAP